MRIKFKLRRMQEGLSQKQLGELLDYTSQQISFIERGTSDGSRKFWKKVKNLWNIPDEELNSYKAQNEDII